MAEFYTTGTIAVVGDGTTVTGTGTLWLPSNVKPGDTLNVNGFMCMIESVTDSTHLELAVPYPGNTNSGLSYAVIRSSASWGTNREIAADTAELIRLLTTGQMFEWVIALSHEDGVIGVQSAVVKMPIPKDVTVDSLSVYLNGASSSGNVVVDVNLDGDSVLTTQLTVEQGENSSDTAATPYVLLQANWDKGQILTIDFDAAGTNATGAKITISGQRRT
jgi:hypothetical protein